MKKQSSKCEKWLQQNPAHNTFSQKTTTGQKNIEMLWKLWPEVVVEETILNKKQKPQNITVCVCLYQASFGKDKEKLKSPSEPMFQGESPSKAG